MATKPKTKKYTTPSLKEMLHDGTPEFEQLVQNLLKDLTIEQDIAKLRRERGLSQTEVAELAGLRQPHIAKMESGNFKNFEIKTLIRIATALGASVEVRVIPDARIARLMRQPKVADRLSARAANQS
ncbi:MAG: Helix-turn-helix domain [Acidobacteriota bacterium]|jgi:predicted XRE-type DNA-binding protein|nr:Helix-turn-helix domain [Acidobacteriota bacterium]MDT7808864.1 Helix-turn-helix domain [Acidobacteriota bacterium]